jgi:apolipoprotein N-acyltransferase
VRSPRIIIPQFLSKISQAPTLKPDSLIRQSTVALATGLLLLLSFPKFDLNFLAWVALAPLMKVIAGGITVRRAFWLGWLTGVSFTFLAENWIANSMIYFGDMLTFIAYGVALLFAVILAIFYGFFAGIVALLVRRFGWWAIALSPIIWVATEWLRPLVTGVTWNALGVSQVDHFPIARLSRIGGVYLISAEIVAVSALIVLLIKIREPIIARTTAILFGCAVIVFALPYLQEQRQVIPGARVKVLGVQPNLDVNFDAPDSAGRDLENIIELTRTGITRAPNAEVDIIVWAESPLTIFYDNDPLIRERLDGLAKATGSHLIISSVGREGKNFFNSVNTISPDGEPLRRYDKMRLVPFGEYIPWRPLLGRFVPTIVGDFTPGTEAVVNVLKLETERSAIISGNEATPDAAIERMTDYVRTGAFICYEAAYPKIVRRFVQRGATLLVNVSNDAWFGTTAGARQHLAHARLRALENARDIVRVTNTGISALITAEGRVIDPLPAFSAGTQLWEARAHRGQTFYTKHGDWFAIGCALVSLLAVAFSLRFSFSREKNREKL